MAGTGTLVVVGDSYGVLTAAHVWEDVLKSAVKMGITLPDSINHKFLIDVKTIVATALGPKSAGWGEWGPDLALLQIPSELVGALQAFKVFEDLNAPGRRLNAEGLECWVAMGTPEELATFTQNHADVEISGDFVDPQEHSSGHDYYDFEVNITRPGVPKSLGGFSGGGLWRVFVYSSPVSGKVEWAQRLKGVIFWQFPIVDGYRVVRCHGPKSILAVVEKTSAIEGL